MIQPAKPSRFRPVTAEAAIPTGEDLPLPPLAGPLR
jgi:hypothetical protein